MFESAPSGFAGPFINPGSPLAARFAEVQRRGLWVAGGLTLGLGIVLLLPHGGSGARRAPSEGNVATAPPGTSPVQRHELACSRGSAESCNALGVFYDTDRQLSADPVTAVSFFELACAGGSAAACSNLGAMYENARGVPRDLDTARRYYALACNAGSALGCSNLGALHFYGHGVSADRRHAQALFTEACAAGDETGCRNLEATP